MKRKPESPNTHEKQRMRAEIDAQVREYLRRGGRIRVLANPDSRDSNVIGGASRGQFDDGFPAF